MEINHILTKIKIVRKIEFRLQNQNQKNEIDFVFDIFNNFSHSLLFNYTEITSKNHNQSIKSTNASSRSKWIIFFYIFISGCTKHAFSYR